MGKDTAKDNAERSGVSEKEAKVAEHVARDDAVQGGFLGRGGSSKNTERFSKSDNSGQAATGFWGSLFGTGKSNDS